LPFFSYSHINSYLKFEINTFIQQGCIKLIKSDSKDIYNVTKAVWRSSAVFRDEAIKSVHRKHCSVQEMKSKRDKIFKGYRICISYSVCVFEERRSVVVWCLS